MTGTDRKVFSRAFRSHWDRENRWRIDGDMAEWSLWYVVTFSAEVQRTRELRTCSFHYRSRGQRHQRRWYRQGGVFGMGRGGGLATSCVSCYSWAVRAVSVVLILFLEAFCLSISSWRWYCRYPKALTTPWGVSRGNDIWRVEFLEGWVWQGRTTYWVAIYWDSPRLRFKDPNLL